MQPKVDFADTVLSSKDNIDFMQMSKLCSEQGLSINRNKLFSLLREHGVIMKNSTLPYQKHITKGLFVVQEKTYREKNAHMFSDPNDGVHLYTKTTITPKGQVFIVNLLKKCLSEVV